MRSVRRVLAEDHAAALQMSPRFRPLKHCIIEVMREEAPVLSRTYHHQRRTAGPEMISRYSSTPRLHHHRDRPTGALNSFLSYQPRVHDPHGRERHDLDGCARAVGLA